MDSKFDCDWGWLLEHRVFGTDQLGPRCFGFKLQSEPLTTSFLDRLLGVVLGEVLIGAIGAKHIGRTHAGNAAVITILRRTWWVVRRQIVKSGGDFGRVE